MQEANNQTSFPMEGLVRVKQAAPFLGIARSTFWLYVAEQRIKKPIKFGKRVSCWRAEYIRSLSESGFSDEADEVA